MFRRKKSEQYTADWWDTPARLARLEMAQLYELAETSLMTAGQQITLYHQSRQIVHLHLAFENARIVGTAVAEMTQRQELLGNA